MPLRDHFRPPTVHVASWEELHGQWPAVIVQHLRPVLPPGYVAGPKVHAGAFAEPDIIAYEHDDGSRRADPGDAGGEPATAAWTAELAVAVETEPPDYPEYEVRVYDATRDRTLVAAIEIVSPANKDRPEARNAFVGKCAALVRKGVAVSIVDLVTVRHFNLYAELMAFLGHPDPTLTDDPPAVYAASCRWVGKGRRALLQAWPLPVEVGRPLPTLPVWLADGLVVRLDLEASYVAACRDLSIP